MKIKNIFVRHDRFVEVSDAIARTHFPVVGGKPDFGSIAAIVGESRVGKSYAARRYQKEFPPETGSDGVISPVVFVEIPIDGQRAFLEAIAEALGVKTSRLYNLSGLLALIIRALQDQRVELLILDELNTVIYERNKRGIAHVQTVLRKILNECRLNILCIGLPETYDLLAADTQLTGRGGLPCLWVRPYSWDNEDERMTFRLLCDEFDRLLPFAERSDLQSGWFAQRLYYSSKEGNVGRLKDFIYSAGCLAINDQSDRIHVKHFADAYERTKPPGVEFNPWLHEQFSAPKQRVDTTALAGRTPKDVFTKKRRAEHVKLQ